MKEKSKFKQWLEQKNRLRERKRLIKENKPQNHEMTLRQIIARYFQSRTKFKITKESVSDPNAVMMPTAKNVTHIAIVLDGVVEDVIRTGDRMAALLLSEPEFIEFNPKEVYPQIGVSEYEDGQFKNTIELKPHVENSGLPEDFDINDYLTEEDKKLIAKREKESDV